MILVMQNPYDDNKWFSPRFALQYFARLAIERGEEAYKSSRYKKAREAWILGLALLGINKLTGLWWWLQVPKEDPPDMRTMTLISNYAENRNEMNYREIEVSQISKYTNEALEIEILRKLKNKSYIKETCLVVYLNRDLLIKDMRIIAKKLEGKIHISDVWVVAAVAKNSSKHILFSLFPKVQVLRFDLFEEVVRIPHGDIVELKSRSKGTEMILVKNLPVSKFIPD